MEKLFSVRKFTKTSAFFLLVFLFAKPVFAAGEVDNGVATLKFLEIIFSNVVSAAIALAGIVLFVMFLIGGFRFITSGGDPKATEAARGTLTHAVLGLVVILLAFLILQLIKTITGVDVTTFKVTQP